MKYRLRPIVCFLAVLALSGLGLRAQGRIDQDALAQLQRMSNTLSAAKGFSYKSTNSHEVPARTGQFLTMFSDVDVTLQRPDKLRILVTGEAPRFEFYYDGSNASAYAPAGRVYSSAKAPPTIDAMLAGLAEETGIKFASAPLLYSNPYRVLTRGLSSAIVVGEEVVRGVPCTQLAFRSPGVNWEIWLESGARALPRRLAVTYTDRTNYPRTMVEFTGWSLSSGLGSGSFVFHPPKGATEIPFVEVLKSNARH